MAEKTLSADQVPSPLVQQYHRGLAIDNNPINVLYQMDIAAGAVVGTDDGTDFITVASPITIDITSPGAGGLDTGGEAPSTWYYIWLIKDLSAGTVNGMFSASMTTPTMPGTYNAKRLVGAVYNDASSNFYGISQVGRRVQLIDEIMLWTGPVGTTWVNVPAGVAIPNPFSRQVLVSIRGNDPVPTMADLFVSPRLEAGPGVGGAQIWAVGNNAASTWSQSDSYLITEPGGMFSIYSAQVANVLQIYAYGFMLEM